jgi:site-specific recombinase XerC
MRIRNELLRLERVGAGLNLALLDTVRPELVRAAVERLHARYAKQTAQSTMKAFRGFVRFSKEKQAITAEQAEALQEAAGAHVLNRDRTRSHTALFPQLIQECERFPDPRRSRDSALVALWAGTDLTWRRLSSLRTNELEPLMASDPRLAPWINRWRRVRGGAPGVLLCKISGNGLRPDESNREESLRGLLNQRLERVAPELSGADARTASRSSFRYWVRA